jgi:hypothetical protein
MSSTVTIRGQQHSLGMASVMVLSPLLSAMGVTEDDSGNIAAMSETDREAYGRSLLKRLAEPTRHYQIAFSLARLFPTVPDELLSYRVWNEGGRRYEDFTLNLDVEELALLIQTAMAQFAAEPTLPPAVAAPEPSPKPSPRGFAPEVPTGKPKAIPAAIKPEILPARPTLTGAELATLEGLPDETVGQLRGMTTYSPILESFGVTESLFEFLKL